MLHRILLLVLPHVFVNNMFEEKYKKLFWGACIAFTTHLKDISDLLVKRDTTKMGRKDCCIHIFSLIGDKPYKIFH